MKITKEVSGESFVFVVLTIATVASTFRAPPLNWLRVKTKETRGARENVFEEISATV